MSLMTVKIRQDIVVNGISDLLTKIAGQVVPAKDKRLQTNIKYRPEEHNKAIVQFVCSGNVFWSRHTSSSMPHKTHMINCRYNAYAYLYAFLHDKYSCIVEPGHLKRQSTDTKFIKNIKGSEFVDQNPKYKNKNGFKISTEVDANGVWFSTTFAYATEADYKISIEEINNRLVIIDTLTASKNNKHKQYMLEDGAYDVAQVRSLLEEKGYTPIIPHNKRNTHKEQKDDEQNNDEEKMCNMSDEHKKIYKTRIVAEHAFAWQNNYPVICCQYERTIDSYIGLYLLASSMMLYKKILIILKKKDSPTPKNKKN